MSGDRPASDRRPSRALPAEAHALYALPLDGFTAARRALVARLRKEGQADAARGVEALRKPTPVLWAINQVARHEPAALRGFLEAVAHLRLTQQRGRADELDEATRGEREAFERVVDLVRRRLAEGGFRASAEMLARVTGTLRGAAADRGRADDLTRGALSEELRAPGFELFAGASPAARDEPRVDKPVTRSRRAPPVDDRTRRHRERAEEALRVAETEASDRRRRAEELERTVQARREPVDRARKAVEEARGRLAEAERQLEDAEQAAGHAHREAERARRDAEKAETKLEAARGALLRPAPHRSRR
jgi:hypothetical protein